MYANLLTCADLASHCRLLLHDHPKYPRLIRYLFLYPLYALAELAIISTDLAELLGTAIGLVLIFPALPLPAAVMLTAVDVLLILGLGNSVTGGRPVRVLEGLIVVLVRIKKYFRTIVLIHVFVFRSSPFSSASSSSSQKCLRSGQRYSRDSFLRILLLARLHCILVSPPSLVARLGH